MTTQPNPTPYMYPPQKSAAAEVSRRALLVTAGVRAACVVATPLAIKYAEEQAAAALQHGLEQGIEQGKEAILLELEQVGDVSIETAIKVAELTKLGVKYIVQPLASFAATIAGEFDPGDHQCRRRRTQLRRNFGYHNDQLDGLSGVLHSWHDNINQLPQSLASYATADINSAETYLTSLKTQIDAAKAKQANSSDANQLVGDLRACRDGNPRDISPG